MAMLRAAAYGDTPCGEYTRSKCPWQRYCIFRKQEYVLKSCDFNEILQFG